MHNDLLQLETVIRSERWAGTVTFAVHPRVGRGAASPTEVVDAFVARLGFATLGPAWRAIARPEATTIVQAMLQCDLAYSHEMMSSERARILAERFLGLFPWAPHYVTNATFVTEPRATSGNVVRLATWDPLTDATLDAGVVCLDTARIGILLVQDED